MRSHPPTLLTLARGAIERHALFCRGDIVLAAVSGGPDSMALLHVLARQRGKIGHRLVAHGVDHGLRASAAAELDLAEELARSLDVPFTRTRIAVAPGGNLQARARAGRFGALRAAAKRCDARCIATAHHADDRAETVLIRLLRGAGPRGLAVLAPSEGDLVRPFIHARRADVLAHLKRHAVPYAEDPSNADPRFVRVRVRRELLPLLTELNAGIVSHLCALADQLAELELEPAYMPSLGRAARDALKTLEASRSSRMRVPLPNGLVATYDDESGRVRIDESPEPPRRRAPKKKRFVVQRSLDRQHHT